MGRPGAALWVIAFIMMGGVLYLGRDILVPFALALFLWFIMDGMARLLRSHIRWLPDWTATTISILTVVMGVIALVAVLSNGVDGFADQARAYEAQINNAIGTVYSALNLPNAPSLSSLVLRAENARLIETLINGIRTLAADLVMVLIYVGFIYVASANWSKKMEALFANQKDRDRASRIGAGIRLAMENYLWVQTVISLITSALTWITLEIMGLENALFWAFVIFIFNYIPTIGSIIATFIPAIFALVQVNWPGYMPDETLARAALVFAGVGFWQFTIGNFLQPRLMGDTLNLSALVVILGLAIWGAIWGIAGMFLSAPLMVLLMILLAQWKSTRWVAILLSRDGQPEIGLGPVPIEGLSVEGASGSDAADPPNPSNKSSDASSERPANG